ncbi:hypothetical protein Q5752_006844 [Cryptotrichosporon argae]
MPTRTDMHALGSLIDSRWVASTPRAKARPLRRKGSGSGGKLRKARIVDGDWDLVRMSDFAGAGGGGGGGAPRGTRRGRAGTDGSDDTVAHGEDEDAGPGHGFGLEGSGKIEVDIPRGSLGLSGAEG